MKAKLKDWVPQLGRVGEIPGWPSRAEVHPGTRQEPIGDEVDRHVQVPTGKAVKGHLFTCAVGTRQFR